MAFEHFVYTQTRRVVPEITINKLGKARITKPVRVALGKRMNVMIDRVEGVIALCASQKGAYTVSEAKGGESAVVTAAIRELGNGGGDVLKPGTRYPLVASKEEPIRFVAKIRAPK